MNSPKQIAENYVPLAVGKANTPPGKAFLLAVLAGIFIAAAGAGSAMASATAGRLAGACVFPAGLAMVILAGSELFTGNCMMVIGVAERKIPVKKLLLSWLVVYLGNFAGGLLVAALTVYSGTFAGFYESLVATAAAKTALSFQEAFFRGILCNILVCLGVWMAFAAKDAGGKILSLFFPVMVFVLCGYEHCIANMFFIPGGLFAAARYGLSPDGLTWGAFFLKNLLPVTLGNVVGGAGLAMVFWAIHLRKAEKAV